MKLVTKVKYGLISPHWSRERENTRTFEQIKSKEESSNCLKLNQYKGENYFIHYSSIRESMMSNKITLLYDDYLTKGVKN